MQDLLVPDIAFLFLISHFLYFSSPVFPLNTFCLSPLSLLVLYNPSPSPSQLHFFLLLLFLLLLLLFLLLLPLPLLSSSPPPPIPASLPAPPPATTPSPALPLPLITYRLHLVMPIMEWAQGAIRWGMGNLPCSAKENWLSLRQQTFHWWILSQIYL